MFRLYNSITNLKIRCIEINVWNSEGGAVYLCRFKTYDMNAFWKVMLGFIGGVIFTLIAMSVMDVGKLVETPKFESVEEARLRERQEAMGYDLPVVPDIQDRSKIQYFELRMPKGYVKLHTGISKDSVEILMGKPRAVDVTDYGSEVQEKWEYRGRNHYINEFTLRFTDGELTGVSQFSDH